MSLEETTQFEYVEAMKNMRIMIIGDVQTPYHNIKAVRETIKFAKDYRPEVFIINGDFVDFYSVSNFDKNPDRNGRLQAEVDIANEVLDSIDECLPRSVKKYFVEGNHEQRLQRFVWHNPALYKLEGVDIKNLFDLDKRKYKLVRAEGDYWKEGQHQIRIGDTSILHGDVRLDGASYSKHSGYSAKNTIDTYGSNVVMNHTHRGAVIHKRTADGNQLTGVEAGCLCNITGSANWQNGFATFESDKGIGYNFQFHPIIKGVLYENRTKSSKGY